jgi:hypothetical protein
MAVFFIPRTVTQEKGLLVSVALQDVYPHFILSHQVNDFAFLTLQIG